jgi:hypothetical protein
MTLLSYKAKYVLNSQGSINTTSNSLQDDTNADQDFALSATQTVLAIYSANCAHGNTEDPGAGHGKQLAINVDGTDYSLITCSAYDANHSNGGTTFWVGSLAAGNHSITGRFCSVVNAKYVTISNRSLIIIILNGDEFTFSTSASAASSTSSTMADDNTSITATPSATCKALALYACSNDYGSTEHARSKKVAIEFAGTNYSQVENSCYNTNWPGSCFTAYTAERTATSTLVVGNFADNINTDTVTISRRHLALLFFAASTLIDINTTVSTVTSTSTALADDAQCTISRTTTDTRELLLIAVGTKRHATTSSVTGECYGAKVNTNDRCNSRHAPFGDVYANSASSCYAETLTAAAHTILGRYSNNNSTNSAKIDARIVIAMWLSQPSAASIVPALMSYRRRR